MILMDLLRYDWIKVLFQCGFMSKWIVEYEEWICGIVIGVLDWVFDCEEVEFVNEVVVFVVLWVIGFFIGMFEEDDQWYVEEINMVFGFGDEDLCLIEEVVVEMMICVWNEIMEYIVECCVNLGMNDLMDVLVYFEVDGE